MKREKTIYIGSVIKRLRKSIGKTQEKLANDSCIDRSFMGEMERNEKGPSLNTIFKLAIGLEMEPEDLVREIKENIDFQSIFNKECE